MTLEEKYEALKENEYFQYFSIKSEWENRNKSPEQLKAEYNQQKTLHAANTERYENPFVNIQSFEMKHFNQFNKNDHIVIQEKIDGSNAHVVREGDSFQAFSNHLVLNEVQNLQGFYFWVKEHYQQIPSKYEGLSVYGEWLTPHHCWYPANCFGEFYVFDVMDSDGKYWKQGRVEELAAECGFQYAPVLYDGEFQDWRHVASLVGKTLLGGEKGEGVVVKNQNILNKQSSVFYVKVVSKEFQETNKARQVIKTLPMDEICKQEETKEEACSIVTKARVRKMLLQCIDNGELSPNWKSLSVNEVTKLVKRWVYKDCLKEEKETMDSIGKVFGKYCNDLTKQHLQELIQQD